MTTPIDPIESYLSELKARGLAENTIKAYKLILTAISSRKPLDTIQKADLVTFFEHFQGSDASRQLYAVSIKAYFKSIGKPEVVEWLKVKKPKESLRADQILTGDDVNRMIEATDSLYWKCLLAILYETGGRAMEVLSLRYSDFLETEKGIVLTITTKKTAAGFRKMLIPLSENYFNNYRDSVKHTKDSLVFGMEGKERPQTLYRWAHDVVQEIGRRAGITKPCHMHAFRHARATDEVRKGTQEAIIRKMLGWSPTSTMIARYISLNDDDVIEAQSNSNKATRTELKVIEKVDVQPVYAALKEENEQLKDRLNEVETLLKRLLDDEDHVKYSETKKFRKKE